MDNAPTKSPEAVGLSRPILISAGGGHVTVLPIKTVLPVLKKIPSTVAQAKGYFQILAGPESGSTAAPTALGEVVFAVENASTNAPVQVSINISIAVDSSIQVEVTNQAGDLSLATLVIPKP